MAVPKQHRSKSRQGQRRMHLFLKLKKTIACPKCARPMLPHTVCANCGTYKGNTFIDVMAKLTKKEKKAKERELEQNPNVKNQSSK